MIIREIRKNPDEVLKDFDYFNDYRDTLLYLNRTDPEQELIERLEKGYNEWLKSINNKKHRKE